MRGDTVPWACTTMCSLEGFTCMTRTAGATGSGSLGSSCGRVSISAAVIAAEAARAVTATMLKGFMNRGPSVSDLSFM